MDDEHPTATALASRDGRLVAVGADGEVDRLVGPDTEVIDAGGRFVGPGFNDAHLHPSPLFDEISPYGRVACGPESIGSIDELVERLRRKADHTPSGQWVKGRGYQDTKLGRHPTREDLDRVSTTHPVMISHSSGHVSACNSYALAMAGIDRDTKDPAGGSFDRDPSGAPNGVLRESAAGRVRGAGPATPKPSKAVWVEGMLRRFGEYNRRGITSIQHAGTSPSTLRKYGLMQGEERLVRIYAMLRRSYLKELAKMVEVAGRGDEWLRIGAIKTFHGNSLSGNTCWLYEPYEGRPGYFGIPPAASQATLNRRVLAIHQAGMQACIHSNGDREIDMVLNAYEAALKEQPRANHRHRIEHASVVNQSILERVKQLGVVLAPHSYIWEHGDKMVPFGKQRWPWMHANATAMRMGISVAGNSDSPVSRAIPLLRIQSMVTRTSAEGKVYGAEQCVTPEQAIRAWTLGSAYASFEEEIKGSLEPGKLADFVVLSRNPCEIPADEIKDINVDVTVVGGRVVYRRDSADEPRPSGETTSP